MAVSRHIRATWIVLGSVFTIATIGFGTVQAVAALAHEDRTVLTVVSEPIRVLDIEASGSVTVLGGDAEDVTIGERVSDGLQHPDRSSSLEGERLVLRGTCGGFPDTWCADDFVVRAPRTVRLIIRAGDITISGVRGGADLTSDGGNVHIHRSAGAMRLSSHGGDITASAIDATRVESSSDGGNTTLSFLTPPRLVDASSHGGNVVFDLPRRSVTYRVDATANGGSIDTLIRTDPSSDRVLRAESDGGNVTIRYLGEPDIG